LGDRDVGKIKQDRHGRHEGRDEENPLTLTLQPKNAEQNGHRGQRDIERTHELELLWRHIRDRRRRLDCRDRHALWRLLIQPSIEEACAAGGSRNR
jgi:hypothetical protein